MDLDDEICLCFHVTKRKIANFLRVENVRRPGQLADCFGAGTGCGWCRPYLEQLFNEAVGGAAGLDEPTSEDYSHMRQHYIQRGGGTPPSPPESC